MMAGLKVQKVRQIDGIGTDGMLRETLFGAQMSQPGLEGFAQIGRGIELRRLSPQKGVLLQRGIFFSGFNAGYSGRLSHALKVCSIT